MIVNFKDVNCELFWKTGKRRRLPVKVHRAAARKLACLHAATQLEDLFLPASSSIKPLRGRRRGQYSIGISDQYRLSFIWKAENVSEVEIVNAAERDRRVEGK